MVGTRPERCPTTTELIERGRVERQRVGRRSHGGFRATNDRTDPLDILAAQDRDRVPELLPLRYGRMSTSAFAFLRGTAAVMAADLATVPTTAITTQLSGDAHLENFGIFATPERRLVFDLNDFDQTLPGPFDWDLKRLSASLVIAARHRGFDREVADQAVWNARGAYRRVMRELAVADVMDMWNAGVSTDEVVIALEDRVHEGELETHTRDHAEAALRRARRRTSRHAAERLTEESDGVVRFREDPPVLSSAALPADRRAFADSFVATYRDSLPEHHRQLLARFEVVDIARRVVGVGSVGTRCYVVLLHGRDADDPLLLQVKEAGPSVLEAHLGASQRTPAGRRVVEGQRTLQSASDVFLGWLQAVDPDGVERDFYVRQYRDMKGGVDLDRIRATGLIAYAELCGRLLADGHARGGQAAMIRGYLGSSDGFREAMISFASDYADVVERDHARLLGAIKAGKIDAAST